LTTQEEEVVIFPTSAEDGEGDGDADGDGGDDA